MPQFNYLCKQIKRVIHHKKVLNTKKNNKVIPRSVRCVTSSSKSNVILNEANA